MTVETDSPTIEHRVTALETRFDTLLPLLATKGDLSNATGAIKDSMHEMHVGILSKMTEIERRLDGKLDRITWALIGMVLAFGGLAVKAFS